MRLTTPLIKPTGRGCIDYGQAWEFAVTWCETLRQLPTVLDMDFCAIYMHHNRLSPGRQLTTDDIQAFMAERNQGIERHLSLMLNKRISMLFDLFRVPVSDSSLDITNGKSACSPDLVQESPRSIREILASRDTYRLTQNVIDVLDELDQSATIVPTDLMRWAMLQEIPKNVDTSILQTVPIDHIRNYQSLLEDYCWSLTSYTPGHIRINNKQLDMLFCYLMLVAPEYVKAHYEWDTPVNITAPSWQWRISSSWRSFAPINPLAVACMRDGGVYFIPDKDTAAGTIVTPSMKIAYAQYQLSMVAAIEPPQHRV